ncbi:MAG TPA: VWA domain-containing protein [Acidimicrobiales bacterium]|nr:VWA domain-containing protein [Acidimicrobiales bacterium]
MTAPRFRYSRWDGTQVGFDLDADAVLEQITDDLLYHGDLHAALRRLLQQGFRDRQGQDVQGVRDLMNRLRQERQERLDRYDLGGVYDEIAEELREVVQSERDEIDRQVQQARDSGDQRRAETAQGAADERNMQLEMLPPDLAGMVRELQSYDFASAEAQRRFEELVEKLRQQVLDSYVNRMTGAVENMTPEDMARMKDMMAELNQMLEQRARGEEPDFDGFMERHGDFFPENPQNLDELLEALARRMAATQAMLASMTPEQRAQIAQLADQLLEDMDLRWQVDQLGSQLRSLFPQMGWDQGVNFRGQDPLSLSQAAQTMEELGDLDRLEQLLRGASNPGALAEADIDRARELMGDDAARSLEQLGKLSQMLQDAGLIDQREGRLELTPKGLRRIGRNALQDLFARLARDKLGNHDLERSGVGHERTYETKHYEFGDPFNLHIERTVRNAVARTGGGTPVRLTPDDFEVERTEQVVRSSTVLMLDLSLSMPMRDNFLAAKKVAMALHSLISMQFPRDYLGLVGFSEVAREIRPQDLPEVSWDFVYGTNMQHAFQISRRLLARQQGTKQIIMITDGEPTAHFEPGMAEPFFSYPPVRETVDATLREVVRCTREGIKINTFMLDPNGHLRTFVEKLTRLNQGRAFFTSPETLGDYVLVDFIEQKREMRRAGGGRRSA